MKFPSSITAASGLAHDQHRQTEKLLATQYAIAQILAGASTLDDAGAAIMRSICETLGWEIGELWALDQQTDVLRCSYFWHVPSIKVRKFQEVTRSLTFHRKSGLPGRVWESGEPVWIADISKDASFVRMPIAIVEGIHGAFGFPIILKSEVLGVMVFLSREVKPPDAELMGAMAAIGNHIGQFIERKRTEAKLHASEAEMRVLFAAMADLIFVVDAEGRYHKITTTNPTLLCRPPDEIIGKTLHELFSPTQADFFLSHVRRALAERQTVPIEYSLIIGGEETWFAGNISPTHNDSVVVVARDITAGKNAERTLRESEKRYKQIVENASEIIYRTDGRGNFTFVNPTMMRVLKYRQDELSGLNYLRVIRADQQQKVGKLYARQLLAQTPSTYHEIPVVAKDGAELWLGQNVQLLFESGQVVGFQAVARDITGRRCAEEKLMVAQKRLQRLLSSSPAIIYSCRAEGDFATTYISENVFNSLGYEPHEFVENSSFWSDHIHPEDLSHMLDAAHSLFEQGQSMCDYRFLHRDGSYRWIHDEQKLLRDADGKPLEIVGYGLDITERKEAEEAVRKGEEYINLFKLANDAIVIFEPEGEIVLDINDKACEIYGFAREDFIGRSIRDISKNASRGDEQVKKLLVQGNYQEFETVQFRADGSPINFLINASVIQYQGGQAVLSINRDITERKRAEQALRESEERFRMFSEASSEGIVIHDRDQILECNNTAALLCGYDPSEVLGMPLFKFASPGSRETIRKHILAGYEDTYEAVALRKDGSTFPAEIIGKTFDYKDQKARLTRFRDITQRKQAEEAVHEADQRAITEYERLLDRVASLAQTLGTARNLATIFRALCEFVSASAPCSKLFISLYDAERHLHHTIYAWCEGEEADLSKLLPMPLTQSPHSRAISTGQIIITDDLEMVIGDEPLAHVKFGNGAHPPQSSLVVPIVAMGRVIGVVEAQSTQLAAFKQEHATAMRMAANLTAVAIENVRLFEREQEREAQLRQSHKMEAVGQLAGGVAHDFNNIVAVIMLQSELLLTQPDQSENSRRRIEEIRKASHRASGLTKQLLAFSRKQVLQPKVLDLNAIVSDMEKMLRRLIGEHIEFLTVPKAGLGQIKADRNQIEQVVMNLSINARDAMLNGGKLTIETADVELDDNYTAHHIGVEPGRYVMLGVSDTGTGMDALTQARIFEPFFTTKEQGKGTGLGLSTVYGIVKQSGGNIWVYSEEGLGTTFKVYLPRLDQVVEVGLPGEAQAALPQGTETILLVEDEEMIRKAAREILEVNGYRVLEASGGDEALMICREHKARIQLLMTDVVMPQMNGRELAERLASLRPELKVLYMSGYTDDAIVHHGVLDEGIAFLEKPFTAKALTHKVRELLDAH
jgi:PAS domain S-box-containing protein